jgi:hypothetical protein
LVIRSQGELAALAHPELAELEVNPALVLPLGAGAFAMDVRARLSPAEVVT